ncbi:MAG: hypothetical protein H4O13_17210 [Xanthomonadales bacterium]|nr:hypothetical protein [Xanthomonadales bacterium]
MSTDKSFGVRAPITPEQQAEFNAPVAEAFGLESLEPRERAEAEALSQRIAAVLIKSLLHRLDPAANPISDPTSLEGRLAAAALAVPPAAIARMAPGLRALARSPQKLRQALGGADLKLQDLKPAGLDQRLGLKLKPTTLPRLTIKPRQAAPGTLRGTPRNANTFTRCHLVLRAIHCVRETQPPGTDEMIFGGLRIGSSGNVSVIKSFDAGDFRTGTYASYGELFLGQYSLRTTPGYPKHLYAIFKLVESDSNDAEVARQLTDALTALAGAIMSAIVGPAVGAAIAGVIGAIGNVIANILDEDEMRPYGIRLTLNNQSQFGSDGVGPKVHTGDITGHGGRYRIGYRWVLGA